MYTVGNEKDEGRTDDMTTRVKAGLEGQRVVFRFDAGHDQFNQFGWTARNAGAAWDGKLQACILDDIDYTHIVVGALETAGFQVKIDSTLATALADRVRDILGDDKAAMTRIRRIDNRLKKTLGWKLRWYQRDGIRWLATRMSALLGDEMGLGKSGQAIGAIPDGSPVMVICPASVKGTWTEEFEKFRGSEFKTEELEGRKSFRWPTAGEALILNYEILPELPPEDCPEGLVLIVDEAHFCKGVTRRARRVADLAKEIRDNGGRSWIMTGTPMINRPDELWYVLKAAGLHTMAYGSWRNFVRIFAGEQRRRGGFRIWNWHLDQVDHKSAIAGLRRVQLRRDRDEVLDLPGKIVTRVPVNNLSEKCLKLGDKALIALKNNHGLDLYDAIIRMGTSMPSFTEMSAAREALQRAKTPVLLEMVESYEAQEQPLVVFSAHRATVNLLGDRKGWAKIASGVKKSDREQMRRDFQAGKLKGIACTIGAAGFGITLTISNNMIFVDMPWSPKLAEQAEDRIARSGQTKKCFIKKLVADHPLDQRVMELLAIKGDLIDATVEAASVVKLKETNKSKALKTVVEKAEVDNQLTYASSL